MDYTLPYYNVPPWQPQVPKDPWTPKLNTICPARGHKTSGAS